MKNNHHNLKKYSLVGIFVALLAIFIIPGISHASELSSATQELDVSVNNLIESKDEANAEEIPVKEQVSKRKEVVSDALDLSIEEVKSIREKVLSTYIDEEELSAIRDHIANWLDREESYFKNSQEKLNAIERDNLDAVKDLAREIKLHRESNYIAEFEKALNFVFISETSRLTNTASERWEKINKDLGKIEKAGLISEGYFNEEMREASKLIENSKSLLNKALDSIKRKYDIAKKKVDEKEMSSSDKAVFEQTSLKTDQKEKINESEKEEIDISEEESLPSPIELCEAAIVNLKSGYGEFVKISISVKKILNLP